MTKLLVTDVETGGLDPAKQSILTLGSVVWEDGLIVDSIEIPIWEDPEPVVEQRAMDINKIDLNELKKTGLNPGHAVQEYESWLGKHFTVTPKTRITLVGHNIGFDVGFKKRLYRLAGADFERMFAHRTLDTSGILRFLMLATNLPMSNPSSQEAFEYFGIMPEDRHTAKGDAIATAKLLTALIDLVSGQVVHHG